MFHPYIPEEAVTAVEEVLRSRVVGQGPRVDKFEELLRKYLGNQFVATVNNGTAAIRLALSVAGVGPTDEVITPAQTSQATNTPILEQFARPVFADVRYDTCTLDPTDIAHRVTSHTKAIICVHWGGYPGDLDEIRKVAGEHGIPVLEDAAHAIGASYRGRKIGSISEYTTFSFQAIKHITTGDGGALALTGRENYERAVSKRWYGIDRSKRKFTVLGMDPDIDIKEVGFKYHMNDLSAAIGIAQLAHIDEVLERRSQIAKMYREELDRAEGVELFEFNAEKKSANWLFCIHVKQRLRFAKYMWDLGIETSIVNWRNDRYSVFGGLRKDLPNTDRLYEDMIAIPMHNRLTDDDVAFVTNAIERGSWLR